MGWELFRRDAADGFKIVGVDGDLLVDAPIAGLPTAIEVKIEAPSTAPSALKQTESAIEQITSQLVGRIAGTIRGETQLWTLIHLPTDEHARRFSEISLPSGASISVAPTVDPEWTVFERVRPVGMEEQSLLDLRVMSQLHAAGDRGGVRRVEHTIVGLDQNVVEAFLAAVSSVLGSIDTQHDGVAANWTISHDADPAEITPDSWTIRQIAERHGAEYDGWGCAVVGGHDSSRAQRRWWKRR
jgi:hypothetical protein